MAESLGGLTLAQLATVGGAVAQGVPLAEALAHEGITPDAWSIGSEAWQDRIDEDVAGEGLLAEEYDALLIEARARFARRIPPLDEDLGAFVHFLRALGESPAPPAFLEERALAASDVASLHGLWSRRLDADPSLRARALAALQEPPRAVAVPPPAPRDPLPARAAPARPSAAPRASGDAPVPPAPWAPAEIPVAPPVFPPREATEPAPPVIALANETLVLPERPVLPGPPGSETVSLEPTAFPSYTAPFAAGAELTLEHHAAMSAELLVCHPDEVHAKYGLRDPAVRARVEQQWSARLQGSAELYERWQRAYAATLDQLGVRGR